MKFWNRNISIALIYLFLSVFMLNSCKESSQITVINPNTADSHFFQLKLVNRIELETTRNSIFSSIEIFGSINKDLIVFDKADTRSILFFDQSGKYRSRTVIGKGPGELIHPTSLSTHGNNVYITDSKGITIYNSTGDYISNIKPPQGFSIHGIEILNDQVLLAYGASIPPDQQGAGDIYIYTSHSPDLVDYYGSFIKSDKNLLGLEGENPIFIYNKKATFTARPSDFIYESDGFTMQKNYFIDFGEKAFKENEYKNGMMFLIEQIRNDKRLGMLDNVMESDDFLVFSHWTKGSVFLDEIFYAYSKKDGRVCKMSDLFSDCGYPNMKIIGLSENEITCYFKPSNLDNSTIASLCNSGLISDNITQESNPVLFIFKLTTT